MRSASNSASRLACPFSKAAANLATAALHFEFASGVHLRNVSIEHTGAQGLWFGAGVFDSVFEHGRIEDVGATGTIATLSRFVALSVSLTLKASLLQPSASVRVGMASARRPGARARSAASGGARAAAQLAT